MQPLAGTTSTAFEMCFFGHASSISRSTRCIHVERLLTGPAAGNYFLSLVWRGLEAIVVNMAQNYLAELKRTQEAEEYMVLELLEGTEWEASGTSSAVTVVGLSAACVLC